MRLDAHQHFWLYHPQEYAWIPSGSALARDWLPEDLSALQSPLGISGSIAVQARQTFEETRWLLELAGAHDEIRGVVGWVDLQDDRVEESLQVVTSNPKLVGVRHVVQDEPDDNFLLRPRFVQGLKQLRQFDLAYDLLIYPRQLDAAIRLVDLLPDQRFVLDHIAKPPIREGLLSPWREKIRELARRPNVGCKVSGLITEANHRSWKPEDFAPFLEEVFEVFGGRRLMFGSDWPVCLLAGSYAQTLALVEPYASRLSLEDQARFWGRNCLQFYRCLDVDLDPA